MQNPQWPVWPVWYDPLSPLGSAVRYIASLSPRCAWVGIYLAEAGKMKLGPSIGKPPEVPDPPDPKDGNLPKHVISIPHPTQNLLLGQIHILSHPAFTLGTDEITVIQKMAKELGELWPE